ncbi:suppressor of Mek1-like [Episyrphus balteatus]|uniref:suppressor of Mek1-like n=1 Tax=Episyrphus balteatus TaxID=286459 RepID=UPI002484D849|nr:suppressor of Mek1-like [Episyrphus balteatus]
MKRCSYQDCDSVRYPCGNITFFVLPTDDRRNIWIQNSGNKSLLNIGDKAHRFICENHFRECDIKNQFTRKTLRKHAVPIEYIPTKNLTNEPTILNFNDGSTKITNKKKNENTEFNVNLEEITTNNQNLFDDDVVTDFHTSQTIDSAIVVNVDDDESNTAPYSLIDFVDDADDLPSTSSLILENQEKDDTMKKEKQPDEETMELYLEENSNDNQVDSSTLELEMEDESQSIEIFVGDDRARECEPEVVPAKEESPTKLESVVETTTTENPSNSNNSYKEDKHYALSLVGYFQRLPQAKKALAKLKILQYLTELEFDMPPTL